MGKKPKWEFAVETTQVSAFGRIEKLLVSGQPQAALEALERLPASQRSSAEAAKQTVQAHDALGNRSAAAIAQQALCNLEPQIAKHWTSLVDRREALSDPDAALAALHQARQAHPRDTSFVLREANIRLILGQTDLAIDELSQALAKQPNALILLERIAAILIQHKRWEEALEVLDVWVGRDPKNPDAWRIRGTVWLSLGHNAQAEHDLAQAFALGCVDTAMLLRWATARRESALGDPIEPLDIAIKLEPNEVHFHLARSQWLVHRGDFDEAIASMRAFSGSEGKRLAQFVGASYMPVIPDSVEQIDALRAAFLEECRATIRNPFPVTDPIRDLQITNFMLLTHHRNNVELQTATVQAMTACCPDLAYQSPMLDRPPVGGRRVRIGLPSAFLRVHAVGRTLRGFVKHLNREQFEVVVIRLPGLAHPSWAETREWADEFIDAPGNLTSCRKLLESLRLDIILFPDLPLDPFTNILSYGRLAPVQATTWGHPGTSGRPSIDHWISCGDFETETSDNEYTEKLHRLSRVPMIVSRPEPLDRPMSRDELALPDGPLFGCIQSIQKAHPDFDPLLVRILREVPDAQAIFVDSPNVRNGEVLVNRIRRLDPEAASRVHVLPRFKGQAYWAVYQHLAASLDPLHYTGANSSMDAYEIACPVVSWPGERLVERQTHAIAKQMGVTSALVGSADEYVNLAVALAKDPSLRESLGREHHEAMQTVYDDTRVAQELSDLLFNLAKEAIG